MNIPTGEQIKKMYTSNKYPEVRHAVVTLIQGFENNNITYFNDKLWIVLDMPSISLLARRQLENLGYECAEIITQQKTRLWAIRINSEPSNQLDMLPFCVVILIISLILLVFLHL